MSYTLSPLVDETKLKIEGLCLNDNPKAMIIVKNRIKQMTDKAWRYLSGNNNAADILVENIDRVDFNALKNTKIYAKIVKHKPDMIDWSVLSSKDDEDAIQLLRDNLDKVDWRVLSANKGAIDILKDNLDNVYWSELSKNENAIEILKAKPDKVVHDSLWFNNNPEAADILDVSRCDPVPPLTINNFLKREEKDLIEENAWNEICMNPFAEKIVKDNMDNIEWNGISYNKSDWAYDLLMENKKNIVYSGVLNNSNPRWSDTIKKILHRNYEDAIIVMIKAGDENWKLKLISNEETSNILAQYYNIEDFHQELHDALSTFVKDIKKTEEIEFLKTHLKIKLFYKYISRCPAIFQ
ncbi:hypothetical protein GUITHDRAFT_149032 [Guillardia theta CCMP2712]|uniref:Uncharacterized protein n=1 Tax=Guillardia theta (strain CCMP2712) TaxID=905079 RepID=L1I718_GUITC|nr:hypothetical protein GUITHDRAFT_149032 [Guillardia theta CCMP2712]EKX31852.1 hypothetical protein GUITHDRAFT_149032 [Guillardia theta CCMP2712]|eukprot:XP_005818832.1 hypothetical protein GUITHDRAFT_149032 [Guillardia theta CCMP2712]